MPSPSNLRPISPDTLATLRVIGSLEGIAGWPVERAAKVCPVFRTITGNTPAPRIPPDVLEDLRELVSRPASFATISTSTLATLLQAYDEQVRHG